MSGRSGRQNAGLGAAFAIATLAGGGCDRLTVESFHGSRVLMTLAGFSSPTPEGNHVEIWARSVAPGGTISTTARVLASEGGLEADGAKCRQPEAWNKEKRFAAACVPLPTGTTRNCGKQAFRLVPALGPFHLENGHAILDDPCAIDEAGNLMWDKKALDPATGQPQGDLAAKALQKHIDDLLLNQPPLLALVPWDDDVDKAAVPLREALKDPSKVDAGGRLCACRNYWYASAAAYTPNPRQLTAPLHGNLLGVVDYVTLQPPQSFGGISFPSDWALQNAVEFWITETTALVNELSPTSIDCATSSKTCRGRVLLDGNGVSTGPGTTHFELRSPDNPNISGSALIEFNLDKDPNQF